MDLNVWHGAIFAATKKNSGSNWKSNSYLLSDLDYG